MTNTSQHLENYIPFTVGIDDTDSPEGMCTTYLGTQMYLQLLKNPLIQIKELPFLIRLNPNAPFRTKGNGSVIIVGFAHPSIISWLQSTLTKLFLSYSRVDFEQTNPGLIIWYKTISQDLVDLGNRALWDIIEIAEINRFLALPTVYSFHPKSKRGLIGSLAGIGLASNLVDFTFELIQYRKPPYTNNRGENTNSVWKIDEAKFNLFNCVDFKNKTVKIFPKGLDPVFCGIRGEVPMNLLAYWSAIQPQPDMDCWMIFKTNQGTDQHLLTTPIVSFSHVKFLPYRVITAIGKIVSNPITEIGGHVSFEFCDLSSNITKKCYAYEPTKEFRSIILELVTKDVVEIFGNVRPAEKMRKFQEVINLEKIKILTLVERKLKRNPACPKCSKRMESAGKNQPFRCKKCKITLDKSKVETTILEPKIKENQVFLPAIDAQRHLTKPLNRTNKNKFDDENEIKLVLEKILDQHNHIKNKLSEY